MTKQRYKIELDREVWTKARTRALETGVTASNVAEEALRLYLGMGGRLSPVIVETSLVPTTAGPGEMDSSGAHGLTVVEPVELDDAPLGELPDLEAEEDAVSFGASRPAPKPAAKARPLHGSPLRSRR